MKSLFSELQPLFDPSFRFLTREGMQWLVDLRCDAETEERMSELADKNQEGTISKEEHRELEEWVRSGTFLSVLQAKARLVLKQTTSNA